MVWRGWIDLVRLDGIGCLEFDDERAEVCIFTTFKCFMVQSRIYLADCKLKQKKKKKIPISFTELFPILEYVLAKAVQYPLLV